MPVNVVTKALDVETEPKTEAAGFKTKAVATDTEGPRQYTLRPRLRHKAVGIKVLNSGKLNAVQ